MKSPLPGFRHSLLAMDKILDKAIAYEAAMKMAPDVLPRTRLIADMLPLWRQITIACDFAKGVAARLTGREVPSWPDAEMTLGDMKARIVQTVAYLDTVPDADFAAADDRPITFKAGGQDMTMPGAEYLARYAIPNFYFHLSIAHAILRSNGLQIGKRDFLGAA